MQHYQLSIVSYLNTLPFIYGLNHSGDFKNHFSYSLDIPSVSAQKLLTNQVDIGLVPVALIPNLENPHIIGNYCIGAVGAVKSVVLYSQVPLNEITHILLDYQSRTSVNLVQVLCKHYWGVSPQFVQAEIGYENTIAETTAGVVIGDRTFALAGKYAYTYDLAEAWYKFTNHPFVFALWVANKPIEKDWIFAFDNALSKGLVSKQQSVDYKQVEVPNDVVLNYISHNISYTYDDAKKQGLELFLNYMRQTQSL